MAELSEETKRKIDELPTEKLLEEINLGNKSHYQREKFDYLKTVYQLRIAQEDTEHKQKTLASSQKMLYVAVGTMIVGVVAIIFQYFSK